MVACQDCKREMNTAESCIVDVLVLRGERFERSRQVRQPRGRNGRCGDCGIRKDGFHHLGCDLEQCPRCRGQLLSCGCCRDVVAQGDESPVGDADSAPEDVESVVGVAAGVAVYPAGLRGLMIPPVQFPFEHMQLTEDEGGRL